jgi:ankyrin repeat protein
MYHSEIVITDLDSTDLHKLCRIGKLDRIKELVQNTDPHVLCVKLATQKGVFGYTVLHEAVASKNTEILDYLLENTKAASVNSTAKSGYTPLHMAASSGLVDSVRVLLKHDADVNCTDEYGRTPRSAARLSTKHETEKLLFSEGIDITIYVCLDWCMHGERWGRRIIILR